LARSSYQFQKRQKELARKQKKELKRQRKQNKDMGVEEKQLTENPEAIDVENASALDAINPAESEES